MSATAKTPVDGPSDLGHVMFVRVLTQRREYYHELMVALRALEVADKRAEELPVEVAAFVRGALTRIRTRIREIQATA